MSDNRQRAFDLARGIGRMFAAMNHASVMEFTVRNGRRADVLALDGKGLFTIVEVKTSVADFQSDAKWTDYLEYCDFYYFGVPEDFPAHILPEEHGLIIADRYGAAIVREPPQSPVNAARRKAQTLAFAIQAARRLRQLTDPRV